MNSGITPITRWVVCLALTGLTMPLTVGAADPKAAPAATAAPPAAPKAPATAKPATSEMPSDLPAAEMIFGVRAAESETEGFGDLLAPVWLFKSGILFLNPRATLQDHDAEEYNLGLGYRHLFPTRNFIVGANIYYDYRQTELDSDINQLGLGVEFLSDWVDARANYYLPEDTASKVAEYDTESVSTTSYTGAGSLSTDPYAKVNQILQYSGETYISTTTTRQHYELYEKALEGFDCEVGVRLPIPVLQQHADVRVFGGYYYFRGEEGLDDIQGFKGRLEIRALPSLFLDAELYQDDELTGNDWFVGARAVIPVDFALLARGHNPFRGALDGFKPRQDVPPFSDRLTEMVMRDFHVQTRVTEPIEDVSARQVTTSTYHSGQTPVVIKDQVTFVDGDNQTGVENGTAEHPYNAVNKGVSNAIGQMIYVYDANAPYLENVVMKDGQILWGSGCLIPCLEGKTFGSGSFPTVDGQSLGPTITVANNTMVAGLRIINTLILHPDATAGSGGLVVSGGTRSSGALFLFDEGIVYNRPPFGFGDQLVVNGTVLFNDGLLGQGGELLLKLVGYYPNDQQWYTIQEGDEVHPFEPGLDGSYSFYITYTGGDGQDIVGFPAVANNSPSQGNNGTVTLLAAGEEGNGGQ